MGDSRLTGLVVITIGLIGVYLEANGLLKPTIATIADKSNGGATLTEFAIASFIVIVLAMFVDGRTAAYGFGIIALGAMFYDTQKNGNNDLLHNLFPEKNK